jgi:hypothetical protein
MPSDKFLLDAWQPNGPVVSDIDFELIQKLNELYRKLTRINKYLENLAPLTVGTLLDESSKNGLEQNIPLFNSMVNEITQSEILQLKNKVIEETTRLIKKKEVLAGEKKPSRVQVLHHHIHALVQCAADGLRIVARLSFAVSSRPCKSAMQFNRNDIRKFH